LAQDSEDNLVVIEIKRSDVAARQTITKICKYLGLIKQEFQLRGSEIRVIIISTEWRELIVPYSEFYYATSYTVDAYQIQLDVTDLPVSKKIIQPVVQPLERFISPFHANYRFKEKANPTRNLKLLATSLNQIGIKDFVIVNLSARKQEIIFHYGIYIAHQRYSNDFYLNIIRRHIDLLNQHSNDDIESEIKNVEKRYNPTEFTVYLEGIISDIAHFKSGIELSLHDGEFGTSSPEGFRGWLRKGYWQIEKIEKFGAFSKDPRLTSEILIEELSGYGGESNTWYFKTASSKHRAKIEEIKNRFANCLEYNPTWKDHIQSIIEYVQNKGYEFNITVSIFNTENILESLYLMQTKNYQSFAPKYYVIIDPITSNAPMEIFHGVLRWKKVKPDLLPILGVLGDNPFNLVLFSQTLAMSVFNSQFMKLLGIYYSTDYYKVHNNKLTRLEDVTITKNKVKRAGKSKSSNIQSFLVESPEFLSQLASIYKAYVVEY